MSQNPFLSFECHLQAQGKRPGTVVSYAWIVARFLSRTGLPAEAVTEEHAYAYLVECGSAKGRTSSWYNVIFHAITGWLRWRGLPTDLRGLRAQRVPVQPPRWLTEDEVRRLLAAVEQAHHRVFFQVMLATGMRVMAAVSPNWPRSKPCAPTSTKP